MTNASTQVAKAMVKQAQALDALAAALVSHGASPLAPFARLRVPSRAAMASLAPAAAADWAIALVHAVFAERKLPGDVTVATKGVGNAARGVRRALARERQGAAKLAA